MSATTGSIQGDGCGDSERLARERGVAFGPGAPTVYLPWLERYWSLWLQSDARNDAWIR